jgi:hypothetical protein
MDGLFGKRRTMFDLVEENDLNILNEAPEDEASAADTGGENTSADDAANDAGDTNDATESEDEMGSDEDFDVDTTMEDDAGDDTGGGDEASGDDTSGGDDLDSGGGGLDGGSEEEVIPKNTDIFASLTKEEQAIKIRELKRLFNNLYVYTNDMLSKVNDINPSEDNLEALYRVTSGLYTMKASMAEYIKFIFPIKSYIENDVAYNRYLTIIQSITDVINTLADEIAETIQKDDKK